MIAPTIQQWLCHGTDHTHINHLASLCKAAPPWKVSIWQASPSSYPTALNAMSEHNQWQKDFNRRRDTHQPCAVIGNGKTTLNLTCEKTDLKNSYYHCLLRNVKAFLAAPHKSKTGVSSLFLDVWLPKSLFVKLYIPHFKVALPSEKRQDSFEWQNWSIRKV